MKRDLCLARIAIQTAVAAIRKTSSRIGVPLPDAPSQAVPPYPSEARPERPAIDVAL
jgi:hypothetical protein